MEAGLQESPPNRVTLYFSSESHIHSLRNVLLLSGVPLNPTVATTLEAIELNYLSHGVFRLYEDLSKPCARCFAVDAVRSLIRSMIECR